MKQKIFKNSITVILVISFILAPLGLAKKTQAQNLSGYVSGLAPAILSLPQCFNADSVKGIGSLFAGNELGEVVNQASGVISEEIESLPAVAGSAAIELESISVHDKTTYEEAKRARVASEKTQKSTSEMNANSTCIQSIGRLIIKMLLQKLTISTVNWINSGFDGSPAFIQDPGKFFGDIAKNEILQFGVELDMTNSPFSKEWQRNMANAYNRKFQDNAQYSLDKLIQETTPEYTAETFQTDFSKGGWNAWTALTQVPANNPMGFKLMADNEIQKRLAGTSQSTAEAIHEALAYSNGFLGDYRCSADQNMTRSDVLNAGIEGQKDPCKTKGGTWEYVTPGALIAKTATNAMDYQYNAYLNAEDLNDAVAAIIDALLGQFTYNIFEDGFVNAGENGLDGSLVLVDDYNSFYDPNGQAGNDFSPSQLSSSWLQKNKNFNIRTGLSQALIDEQRTYVEKLKEQNRYLYSTTDGKTYVIDSATHVSNARGLIPTIHQLDFCIPGPHPGWEEDSKRTLTAAENEILAETQTSLEELSEENVGRLAANNFSGIGAALGPTIFVTGAGEAMAVLGLELGSTFAPIVGTIVGAIAGIILSFLVDLFEGSDDNFNVRLYYATIIFGFTGFMPNYELPEDSNVLTIMSKAGTVNALNVIFERYKDIMNKTYFSNIDILPSSAVDASVKFKQLKGYGQMVSNNEGKIATMNQVINVLTDVKKDVDELNLKLESNLITIDEYEESLIAPINAFGRLTIDMINGDDISKVNELNKQILQETEYIYNHLLKGPYGCEADLEKLQTKFPSVGYGFTDLNRYNGAKNWEKAMFPQPLLQATDWANYDVNSVKRVNYPFPVLYDYNAFTTPGTILPDPLNNPQKYSNKVPTNSYDIYGPGFLSFVFFGSHPAFDRSNILQISDLMPTGNEVEQFIYRSVGLRKEENHGTINKNNINFLSGTFETIIGIY